MPMLAISPGANRRCYTPTTWAHCLRAKASNDGRSDTTSRRDRKDTADGRTETDGYGRPDVETDRTRPEGQGRDGPGGMFSYNVSVLFSLVSVFGLCWQKALFLFVHTVHGIPLFLECRDFALSLLAITNILLGSF